MRLKVFKNTVLFPIIMGLIIATISCGNVNKIDDKRLLQEDIEKKDTPTVLSVAKVKDGKTIIVGANRMEQYLSLLQNKRVGVVANQTSVIFKEKKDKRINSKAVKFYTHLVDSLLVLGINIKKVFAPEHGFRGTANAGEVVKDGIDTKTRLPIVSLYGKNKKPSVEQLSGLDIVVFDIQDVGARFYTYISSLHYVMEACAEQNIPILILDRPNPNGHYVDGPILEIEHKSFIGMHPIPVVHGMTIGEYAQMINGKGWLKNRIQCALKIIPVKNYTHQTTYSLPIKPSPNLPNDKAINLYPSLCFFEGTNVSIGRGTDKQFQVVGSPFLFLKPYYFEFTPQPNRAAKYPKHQDKTCHGYDLSKHDDLNILNLNWLIEFYKANKKHAPKKSFFTNFFTKLAGTKKLQQQIEDNLSIKEIRESWKVDLENFKQTRQNYLIYD